MAASSKASDGVELAAGGLVWFNDGAETRIAVVHRRKHQDWTLPKGKPDRNEGMEGTALREAMEETGWQVSAGAFAGTYNYLKNDRPKIVLMWHMARQPDLYEHPAPNREIDEVAWLPPQEAMERLTHEVEREFVRRHCLSAPLSIPRTEKHRHPKFDRLLTALQHVREQFKAMMQRRRDQGTRWWAQSARRSLEATEAFFEATNLDAGWGALHDAERFMIFGLNDRELVNRAISLQSEVRHKLKGWRAQSAALVLSRLPLLEWAQSGAPLDAGTRSRLEEAVVELLNLINEHSNNTYHRMHLVEIQLQFLVKACGLLLLGAFFMAWLVEDDASPFRLGLVLSVAVAGALGGVVSAMYQLSRVGQAKIPEALLHGLITSGRPIVGAACALFVHAALQSGLINLIDPGQMSLAASLVLGFIAGFSEQFVLNTVSRVAGNQNGERSAPVPNTTPQGKLSPGTAGANANVEDKTRAGAEAASGKRAKSKRAGSSRRRSKSG